MNPSLGSNTSTYSFLSAECAGCRA
uniref:Uncharacterized protein n=1 Tax=Arundo donax TaxID=35708 RepID=A0A0A9A1K3_ARUDO